MNGFADGRQTDPAGLRELTALIGLKLSIARNAADMKVFHFGDIRPHASGRGTVGAYALHVQCPWRIVTEAAVLTGSGASYAPPFEGVEIDDEDKRSGNLQRVRLNSLLEGFDAATQSHINMTSDLVVQTASADRFGSIEIGLSGGYTLQVFPDGSVGEEWRLIQTGGAHLVFEDGKTYEI